MAEPVKIDGATPKKVYIHYEEGEEALHVTLKMTLPSKWAGHTVDYLKEFFVDHYNKKKPENAIAAAGFHFEKKSGAALFGDDLLHTAVEKYEDIFLKAGASATRPPKAEVAKAAAPVNKNLVQCKNYGCRAKFEEATNHDQACRHHVKPPLFHDTKKGWQCCSSKMVYDWDDFEKIEPCAVGRHSVVEPSAQFAQSPTVALAESAGGSTAAAPPAPVLKSIDDYNKSNPAAVTAVSAAFEAPAAAPAPRADGKAKCVNFGCQKEYVVAENHPAACVHHAGAPVFHDAGKYWSCCPKQVKYEFDAFLQVPGCTTSPHRDVKA